MMNHVTYDVRNGLSLTDPRPAALFPGSFDPLHHGHRALAAAAEARLGQPVHYELSVANVDKPDLSDAEVARRVRQFRDTAPVWVTRAARFDAKSVLFPETTFVLGFDTAVRLIDPKYYSHDPARRDAALSAMLDRGCRFVVGGRRGADGVFRVWESNAVPATFREMFTPLSERDFRADVSSTELRTARVSRPAPRLPDGVG